MKKQAVSDVVLDVVKWGFLVLFTMITLYPIINTLAVSFNEGMDTIKGGIYFFPREITFNNFATVFKMRNLSQAAVITVSRTFISTVVQTFLISFLAYILSRDEFVFRKPITMFYIFTMYINAGLIPNYLLMQRLGLLNSFWVYIIPGAISAFNLLVVRTYMNGLPNSLVESAKLDGASHMRIFFSIILPLCKPVLATVALFIAVGQWNSWFDTMLYNGFNDKLTTLQYELMKLLSSVTSQGGSAESMKNASNLVTPASIRAATTIVAAAPIVCLYPFLQRYFISGLTIGGVKE